MKAQVQVPLIVLKEENESALRVLLLDDDPLDVKLLQDTLRESINCRVTVVDTKPALLLNLWKEFPDVMISDTNIPGFEVWRTLKFMRHLDPDIPFVICSGSDNQQMRAKALAAGATAWVSKSDLPRLVAVVNEVCGPR